MPKRSPNALIRERYAQGQSVIAREEHRKLTQREFLDVAFGLNPKTGKPYNTRTLRKWMNGERDASAAIESAKKRTYSFQQRATIGEDTFGPVLTKPSNVSGLDLFTPTGRKRVRRAAKERLEIQQGQPGESPKVRDLRSTRGMKLRKARAVSKFRASVIIRRKAA